MNIGFQRFTPAPALLDEDDVLTPLRQWRGEGLRTALVTLVGVDGGAPRQPGAQMAVAEDGRYAGYLSGGCLEQAVALEAQDVIAKGANRTIRYGKGSPYFDIKLPCGSGLDLYFDQAFADEQLQALLEHRAARRSCSLATDLSNGASTVEAISGPLPLSGQKAGRFTRVYAAPIRLALIGSGPALTGIASLAKIAGLDLAVWSGDEATLTQVAASGGAASSGEDQLEGIVSSLDETSAAVVVFHDHDAEPQILRALLQTSCFYIGVLGNRGVHRMRIEALAALGVSQNDIDRLHAPVGVIGNAKSKTTFAFGVLAELLAEAKARNLVA